MNWFIRLFILCATLVACSGDKGGVRGVEDPESEFFPYQYTEFMKAVLSRTAGEDYDPGPSGSESQDIVAVAQSFTAASDSSFSTTNVQVRGVDEADLLKFDGDQLLYLNRSNNWNFLPNNNIAPARVSLYKEAVLEGAEFEDPNLHYPLDGEAYYNGLFIHGDHAALIESNNNSYTEWLTFVQGCLDCPEQETQVSIKFWQYKEEGEPIPVEASEVKIDGNYIDSRAIGDKLYIVSRYQPYVEDIQYYPQSESQRQANQRIIDELDFFDLTPNISLDGISIPLITSSCTLPDIDESSLLQPNIIFITEIQFDDPSSWRSACSVGYSDTVFASPDNIYISSWKDDGVEIRKYALTGQGPRYRGSGTVNGFPSGDSYYYGEVQGKLVFVNSVSDGIVWNPQHQLSVLEEVNGRLEVVAQIPNEQRPEPIGKPGENIYAVRIFGERAYIVTFQKVDPLYAIDLSDPYDPQVLGELEIPGYSAYLHPVADDLVLGIGKNAVEDPSNNITWYAGLNMRLFDVSDPNSPILLQSLDYGLRGSESEVLNNPHAFTYLYDENTDIARFTIPMSLHGDAANPDPGKPLNHRYDFTERGLYQFELDAITGVVSERGRYLLNTMDGNNYYSYGERSVINGNSIYYAHGDVVDVLQWGGSEPLRSFSASDDP